MTERDRVLAALRGQPVDRPPISFWGHVYHRESSARDLAEHTVERWRRFGWDWIKINPRKHYHVEDWGVRYRYPGVPDEKPVLERWPVHEAADWDRIAEIPHDAGALGEQLEAVRLVRAAVPPNVPVLATVFTPLAILAELTEPPGLLREHLVTEPARVARALEVVTRVFERLAGAYLRAGADGLYLATVDWGCRRFVTPEGPAALVAALRPAAARRRGPVALSHDARLQGRLSAVRVADYPVGAFSWDALAPANPSLAEGLARLPGAVMGGIAHEGALQDRNPEAVLEQYRRALAETGGRRWLVAPGCSIPPHSPEANLAALRDEVARAPASGGRLAG